MSRQASDILRPYQYLGRTIPCEACYSFRSGVELDLIDAPVPSANPEPFALTERFQRQQHRIHCVVQGAWGLVMHESQELLIETAFLRIYRGQLSYVQMSQKLKGAPWWTSEKWRPKTVVLSFVRQQQQIALLFRQPLEGLQKQVVFALRYAVRSHERVVLFLHQGSFTFPFCGRHSITLASGECRPFLNLILSCNLLDESFPLHTHPGHHLIYVVRGGGTIMVDGLTERTIPGDLYMVQAELPHAFGALANGQYILSFGAPHIPIDSPDRMHLITEDDESACNSSSDEDEK